MASLELVDHTQDLRPWRLPEQQHGAQAPESVGRVKNCPLIQKRVQRRQMARR